MKIFFKSLIGKTIEIEIEDSCEVSILKIKEKIISQLSDSMYRIEGGSLMPEDIAIVIAGKKLDNDKQTLKNHLSILNRDLKDLDTIYLVFKKKIELIHETEEIKYSAEYFRLKDNISETYIQPFIDEINKAGLSVKYVVQESMRRFQIEVAPDILGLRTPGSYLDDINNSHMPEEFKELLMTHAGLCETYKILGKIYINNIGFGHKSHINPIHIQTIIRELLTDMLAPFPEFRPASIDTSSITTSLDQHNISSALLDLPKELQLHINNFFQNDIHGVMSYRTACKATYATQKKNQDNIRNIYYTVTKPIRITQPRGWMEGSVDICLRDSITDKELIDATKISKNKKIQLFRSLHDAQEYAQYMQHGGHVYDSDNVGVMPAVMMVSAIANFEFKFRDEVLTLNPNTSSSAYSDNQRSTWISYANVPANAVLPLAAISLFQVNIGQFHILNKNLHLNPDKLSSTKITLQQNVERNFSTLSLKAKDLSLRGYIEESKNLLKYARNLQDNLHKLQADISIGNTASLELINDFKNSCEGNFVKIMSSLDHHRGYKHIIVEALLSIITVGIYFVAMCVNKLKNDRFTFFTTDTGNKLKDIHIELNDYLTHLAQQFVENVTTNESGDHVAARLG